MPVSTMDEGADHDRSRCVGSRGSIVSRNFGAYECNGQRPDWKFLVQNWGVPMSVVVAEPLG
jgi:hypothetical protein